MSSKKELNSKFLISLLSSAFKRKTMMAILTEFLKEEHLPNRDYFNLLKELNKHWKAFKSTPSLESFFQKFDNDDDVFNILIEIDEYKGDTSDEELIDELEKFIKSANFIRSYTEVGKLFNQGQKQKAFLKFQSSAEESKNFTIKKETFEKVVRGFAERNLRAKVRKNSENEELDPEAVWGIDELDELTGGIKRKQLVCLMAPSGGGKTKSMRWTGAVNARRGLNVLHIQLEGSKEECVNGYGATFSGVNESTLSSGNIDPELLGKLDDNFKKIGGEVFVKVFEEFAKSPTTANVRRMIQDAEKSEGKKMHLVIVDYLEKLNTSDGRNWSPADERHRRTEIADELKDIATEFDLAMLTATQAATVPSKDLNDPDFVLTRYDVSEAKGIVKPLTMFVTINRTFEEGEENKVRLFVDKSRFSKANVTIEIATDYNADRFYNRGETRERFGFTDQKYILS